MPKRFGYLHRTVAQFSVNHAGHEYTFKNNRLIIMAPVTDEPEIDDQNTENLNAGFLQALKGMEPRDRNAIVHLKEIENEATVGDEEIAAAQSRAIRGAVQTSDIKAPIRTQNVNGLGIKVGASGAIPAAAPVAASGATE